MDLPESVSKALEIFTDRTKEVFENRLVSIVLYGSAAEGRLRRSSDVNLLVVTKSFLSQDAAALSSALKISTAAVDLQVMFLLEEEIATASELFAVKFLDIARRRKVLFGSDPFGSLHPSKEAIVARLRQVILNHLLRLRFASILRHDELEPLKQILADSVSPLRATASAILDLRGVASESPKQALEILAAEVQADGFKSTLTTISEAREQETLPRAAVQEGLAQVIELTSKLKTVIDSLNT